MHKPCIDIIWSRSLGDYLMLKGKPFAVRPSISMEGWNLAIKAAFCYTIDILFSLKKNIRWNTRYIISIICHMYGNVSRTTAVQIWIFKSPIRCSTYYSFFFFFFYIILYINLSLPFHGWFIFHQQSKLHALHFLKFTVALVYRTTTLYDDF